MAGLSSNHPGKRTEFVGSGKEERKGSAEKSGLKKRRYIYGNYDHYYGYRIGRALEEDPRLKLFRPEWFQNRRCLDIGCNEGYVTIAIAQRFRCQTMVGLDIDEGLVKTAVRRLVTEIQILRGSRDHASNRNPLQGQKKKKKKTKTMTAKEPDEDDDGQEAIDKHHTSANGRTEEEGQPHHNNGRPRSNPEAQEEEEVTVRELMDLMEVNHNGKVNHNDEVNHNSEESTRNALADVDSEGGAGLDGNGASCGDMDGGSPAAGDEDGVSHAELDGSGASALHLDGGTHAELESRGHAELDPGAQGVVPEGLEGRTPCRVNGLDRLPGLTGDELAARVRFKHANFLEEQGRMRPCSFDTILCLSVTKWIHLNWGDDGIKKLFGTMYRLLAPGGILILEPQPLKSYQSKRHVSEAARENFANMKIDPSDFVRILLEQVGFYSFEEITEKVANSVGGFNQRPLYIFHK